MKPVYYALLLAAALLLATGARGQSVATYVNPIIPGDHPDPTLTKIDTYFYTSGSSFNVTP
jgi:beta-xylosidase